MPVCYTGALDITPRTEYNSCGPNPPQVMMKPSGANRVYCETLSPKLDFCKPYADEFSISTRQGEYNASLWTRETVQVNDE
eukprot:1025007-Pyramimonas_sp.AAC.1